MRQSTRFALLVVSTIAIDVLLVLTPPGLSNTLDVRLFYGADEALGLLARLGPRGRNDYFVHECIDVGFIVAYTSPASFATGSVVEGKAFFT